MVFSFLVKQQTSDLYAEFDVSLRGRFQRLLTQCGLISMPLAMTHINRAGLTRLPWIFRDWSMVGMMFTSRSCDFNHRSARTVEDDPDRSFDRPGDQGVDHHGKEG